MRHGLRFAGALLILLAAACTGAGSSDVDYAAALVVPGRPAEDFAQDATRKPVEVLEFFGVRPGMSVLDLYSGAGYFTELLANVVGPTGRVVAHNNSPYLEGAKEQLAQRFADPRRLPNVQRLNAENNALELPTSTFDFVLLSAVYHDVYFVNEANGWPKIDGPALLAELFTAMKPGAALGLIDHAAAAGSPPSTGGTLHRIDPEVVKRDFAAAGFVFEAESDVLRNPIDDFGRNVFDPAVRGKTDRFVFRFRRP
jgi:predicted methyltransferase